MSCANNCSTIKAKSQMIFVKTFKLYWNNFGNTDLRSESHTAFEGDCFTVHIFKIGICQLNARSADFKFGVSIMTCRRHFYVCFESVWVCFFKIFKLSSPSKRANYVCVDAVLCPFGSRNSGKTSDSFFCSSVRALTVISEKSCTGCENDNTSLCLFKIWIASLHIVESSVKA